MKTRLFAFLFFVAVALCTAPAGAQTETLCNLDKDCDPCSRCLLRPSGLKACVALNCTGITDICFNYACEPATGACTHAIAKLICDDNNACTTDSCDPAVGCVTGAPVAEGTVCSCDTESGTCRGGVCDCTPVTPVPPADPAQPTEPVDDSPSDEPALTTTDHDNGCSALAVSDFGFLAALFLMRRKRARKTLSVR